MTDEPSRAEILAALAGAGAVVPPPLAGPNTADPAFAAPGGAVPNGAAPKKRGRPRKAEGERKADPRAVLLGVLDAVDLWQAPDGEVFASFEHLGRRESRTVTGVHFSDFLRLKLHELTGQVATSQPVEDIVKTAAAMARATGPVRTPILRAGRDGDAIVVDHCDAEWHATVIRAQAAPDTRHGAEHRFPTIRYAANIPLPLPDPEGAIDDLRQFVNVEAEADFVLIVGWLVCCLRGKGPFPILALNGQQGSGKSTLSRLLRSLVDPNSAPIRALPREERDLLVMANNALLICLDNVSRIEAWLSDALCRIATGGGFSARQLHSDKGEAIFQATRPILLNGIPSLGGLPDLADRMIGIRLRTIGEAERRTEEEVDRDWDVARPKILGALFAGLSGGLRNGPRVAETTAERPRMADAAVFAEAALQTLGFAPGAFLAAYKDNRADTAAASFEADEVAKAIARLVPTGSPPWEGSPTDLLSLLNNRVDEDTRNARSWPRDARNLGIRVDRAAPVLRSVGVDVTRHHSGGRLFRIARFKVGS